MAITVERLAYEVPAGAEVGAFNRPTGTEDWEFVKVPEKDIFDEPHQGAAINHQRFERGRTYLCNPTVAQELRGILARHEAQNVRILQPRKDTKALEDLIRAGKAPAPFLG